MKYAALIFGDDDRHPKTAAGKSPEPGQIVRSIDGSVYRVASKIAGPDGVVVKLANLQGKPVQTPPNFKPVGLAVARFASWLRYHLAYQKDFDLYVNAYIEQYNKQHKDNPLPYPVGQDGKAFRWSNFFQKKISPKLYVRGRGNVEDQQAVKDDIIHEMLFNTLGERHVLDQFVAKAKKLGVNKQNAAGKLTDFLISTFMYRIDEMQNKLNARSPEEEVSMYQPGQTDEGEGEINILETEEHGVGDAEFQSAEARKDVARFRESFRKWLAHTVGPKASESFVLMFDIFWRLLQTDESGEIKRNELQDEWMEKTGLSFGSFKDYFTRLPEVMESFITSHATELGEKSVFVDLMNTIRAERGERERKERRQKQKARPAMVSSLHIAEGVEEDFQEAAVNTVSPLKVADGIGPDLAQAISNSENPDVVDPDIKQPTESVNEAAKGASSKIAQNLIRGDQLDPQQRQQVLNAFPYRWTRENPHRVTRECPNCDVRNDPFVGPSAQGHNHPTIPLQSDDEWVRDHAFWFTNAGKLFPRRSATPASYAPEPEPQGLFASVAHRFAMEKTRKQADFACCGGVGDHDANCSVKGTGSVSKESGIGDRYMSPNQMVQEFTRPGGQGERIQNHFEEEQEPHITTKMRRGLGDPAIPRKEGMLGHDFNNADGQAINDETNPDTGRYNHESDTTELKERRMAASKFAAVKFIRNAAITVAQGEDAQGFHMLVNMNGTEYVIREPYADQFRREYAAIPKPEAKVNALVEKYMDNLQPYAPRQRSAPAQAAPAPQAPAKAQAPKQEGIPEWLRRKEREDENRRLKSKALHNSPEIERLEEEMRAERQPAVASKQAAQEIWECMDCGQKGEFDPKGGTCATCGSQAIARVDQSKPADVLPIREPNPLEVEKRMIPRREKMIAPAGRLSASGKTAEYAKGTCEHCGESIYRPLEGMGPWYHDKTQSERCHPGVLRTQKPTYATPKTAQGSGNTTTTFQNQNVTTPNSPNKAEPMAVPEAIDQAPGPHSPNAPMTAPRTPGITPKIVNVPPGTEGEMGNMASAKTADGFENLFDDLLSQYACPKCGSINVDVTPTEDGYDIYCEDCEQVTPSHGDATPGGVSGFHATEPEIVDPDLEMEPEEPPFEERVGAHNPYETYDRLKKDYDDKHEVSYEGGRAKVVEKKQPEEKTADALFEEQPLQDVTDLDVLVTMPQERKEEWLVAHGWVKDESYHGASWWMQQPMWSKDGREEDIPYQETDNAIEKEVELMEQEDEDIESKGIGCRQCGAVLNNAEGDLCPQCQAEGAEDQEDPFDKESAEEGEDKMQVAKTILEQLGGNKFRAMTGAKNFVGGQNSLTFRLPGSGGFTKDGINAVQITLDPSDTYTVTFSRIRGGMPKVISMHRDIYVENLREVFEQATGLATSLGTMGKSGAGSNSGQDDPRGVGENYREEFYEHRTEGLSSEGMLSGMKEAAPVALNAPAPAPISPNVQQNMNLVRPQMVPAGPGGTEVAISPGQGGSGQEDTNIGKHTVEPELPNSKYHMMGSLIAAEEDRLMKEAKIGDLLQCRECGKIDPTVEWYDFPDLGNISGTGPYEAPLCPDCATGVAQDI